MAQNRNQDARLQVRCTAKEKERLKKAAAIERRNLSNFVVASALEKADKLLGPEDDSSD